MSQEKAAEIIDFSPSSGEGRLTAGAHDNDGETGAFQTTGAFLAAARRAAGLSLEAVSDLTNVKPHHIAAIEAMRPDLLPATPYAVGFVKSYAGVLDLDAAAMARQFKQEIGAGAPAPLAFAPPAEPDLASDLSEGMRLGSLFVFIAIILFVFWITVQIFTRGEQEAASPDVMSGQEVRAQTPLGPGTTAGAQAGAPPADQGADQNGAVSAAEASPAPSQALPSQVPSGHPAPRIKPVITASALTQSVSPSYLDQCEAGAAPVESVTVVFDITAEGRAANASVVSSTNGCFEAEALRALNAWRFSPRMIGGKAVVDAGKRATLNFRL